MKCNRVNCVLTGEPGTLIRVSDFYVCNKCCTDIYTLDEIERITAEDRNCFVDMPGGDSVHIRHPEHFGWYNYEIRKQTKWVNWYRLLGRDGDVVGSVVSYDYSECDFIKYNGPNVIAHMKVDDHTETFSIKPDEIDFY